MRVPLVHAQFETRVVTADRRRRLAGPKAGAVSLRPFALLPTMPRITIEQVCQKLATTFPTATAAVEPLEQLGIVSEMTGQKKNRSFSHGAYVELLTHRGGAASQLGAS